MKKIVSVLKPFTFQQNIFIYEDGVRIDNLISNWDTLQEDILYIALKNNINEINLLGSNTYSEKIKEKIKELELTKYNENKLNINLINI